MKRDRVLRKSRLTHNAAAETKYDSTSKDIYVRNISFPYLHSATPARRFLIRVVQVVLINFGENWAALRISRSLTFIPICRLYHEYRAGIKIIPAAVSNLIRKLESTRRKYADTIRLGFANFRESIAARFLRVYNSGHSKRVKPFFQNRRGNPGKSDSSFLP